MALAQSLYHRCPIPVQNLLVSAYGWRLKRRRYGRHHDRILAELQLSERFDAEQIADLQRQRLAATLANAASHVPFYRESWPELGLDPGTVSADEFASLPVLDKETVRVNQARLVSDRVRPGSLMTVNTSGSTGTPLTIRTSYEARQANYAFFTRFMGWAGVQPSDRSATFAGRFQVAPSQTEPPFWRSNWTQRNWVFSSYNLDPRHLTAYVRALEERDLVYIDAFPSVATTLAAHILETGIRPRWNLEAILTTGETLYPRQREMIESAFGATVFDQYGNAEMVSFVSQCEAGTYHIHPEYGLLELLDETGRPVPDGSVGRVVCTSFLNPAMPLIRYDTGDLAVRGATGCACGRAFPTLAQLTGRRDDQIVTPTGRLVGRLASVYKGTSGYREAQIVQRRPDLIAIRIVRAPDYVDETGQKIRQALQNRVGADVEIVLEFPDRIERSRAGKFRAVVSEVSRGWASFADTEI